MECIEELGKSAQQLLQKFDYKGFFEFIDPAIKVCEMRNAKKLHIDLLIFKAAAYERTDQIHSGFELLAS